MDDRPVYVQGFGGDTSTAIVAAARQGAQTGYLTALGNDMFGDAIRALWVREGVDCAHVTKRDRAPTGVCFIDPDPSGRSFTYARTGSAASTFEAAELPRDYIAGARILHLSGITLAISEKMRQTAFSAMGIAKASGTLVSYDLNHRPALWDTSHALAVTETMMPQLDIVFPSEDEAQLLFGDTTPDQTANRFLGAGASIVVVKRAERGAYLATRDLRQEIPPAPSHPVDASGAGDSFAGAFLAWYLETDDPYRAACEAAKVAAATVSGLGAIEPIPRRA
ncbi:MAG: sugar kinase [Pseudomonadota bacterium]